MHVLHFEDNKCRGTGVPISSSKDELSMYFQGISSMGPRLLTDLILGPSGRPRGAAAPPKLTKQIQIFEALASTPAF
jgi:hypothetical protein